MSEASIDDLMKELNGGAGTENKPLANKPVTIQNIDVTPEPAKPDPLDVSPKTQPSAVASLDAKHSTAAGGKGYALTVKGEYYAPAKEVPGKKTLKPYSVVINVTHLEGALSTIKNKALDTILRKRFSAEGYLGFRTHEIVEARPLGGAPESMNLQYMDINALTRYIDSQRIPVDLSTNRPLESIRISVMDFAQNVDPSSEVSLSKFTVREEERVRDFKERAALAELNPELAEAA